MKKMSPAPRLLAIALLLATAAGTWLAFPAPARAEAKLAALVTDAQGKVEMQREDKWIAATIMTQVQPGATLRAATGAQARLSFVKGGLKGHITGPCTVRVETDGMALVEGSPASVKLVRPDGRPTALLAGKINLNRMMGLRNRGDRIYLYIPAALTTVTPVLEWYAEGTWKGFEITIVNDDSKKEVYRASVEGNIRKLEVPAGKLTYGQFYEVGLTRVGADGGRIAPNNDTLKTTRVLEKANIEALTRAQAEADAELKANPDDVSPLVILMRLYRQEGCYLHAMATCERLRKMRPNDAYVYRQLANLHGLMSDWAKSDELKAQAEKIQAAENATDL